MVDWIVKQVPGHTSSRNQLLTVGTISPRQNEEKVNEQFKTIGDASGLLKKVSNTDHEDIVYDG